jgi:hypothetical protein
MGRSRGVQRTRKRDGGKGRRKLQTDQGRLTFERAVEQTPDLIGAWLPGLRALRQADRKRIDAGDPSCIKGSVDVESRLQARYRDERQWDYAIGFQPANLNEEVVYWIEVHPASPGEVRVVLEKLSSLQRWLRSGGAALNTMRKAFIWISSGKTTLTDRQRRRLTLLGLNQRGRFFTVPAEFKI